MDPKKILIVEDNPIFSDELARCLEKGGFLIFTAPSIQKALEIIKTEKPDGISLDIQLEDSLGFNLINTIISDDYYNGALPNIIVVSSLISLQTIPTLHQHQIPYYDKTLPTFNCQMVLDYFTFALNGNSNRITLPTLKHEIPTTDMPFNTDNLRTLIEQRLDIYSFNRRPIAYQRLVDGVYYTLVPAENQANSLTSIFVDVLDVDFNAAFVGMKKLLIDTFRQNPDVFCDFYHKKSKAELQDLGIKVVPTPSDFIYHIVTEIKRGN